MASSPRMYVTTGLSALLLTGLFLIAESSVPFVNNINIKGRDFFFRLQHALSPPPSEVDEIVLANVDDETLRRLESHWPYPRSIYAEVIERLKPFSPKAIGFDLIFSGKDLSPESDTAFVNALEDLGNVVIATHQNAEGEVGPTSSIREGAWRVGFVDKPRDSDRMIRRSYLSLNKEGEQYNSWELELFKRAFSESQAADFPLGSGVAINYRVRFDEFTHISFWRLLEGSVLDKEIRDKIVLIGLTAEVFHDIHATPLGPMPGLAVNANTLLTLMRNDFFSSTPRSILFGLFLFSTWVALLLAVSNALWIGIFGLALLSLLHLWVGFILFSAQVLLDPWLVILSAFVTFFGAHVFLGVQMFLGNLRLRDKSSRDPLSGFYERKLLALKLNSEFRHIFSKRELFKAPGEISVVIISLDNFHLINENFGRAEGDRVLLAAARALLSAARQDDFICRYGGDEFCIVLPGTSIENAAKFSEKIRTVIAARPDLSYQAKDGTTIRVTSSIGVASAARAKAFESGALLKAVDRSLDRAKAAGRNQVCIFDPSRDRIG